MLTILPFSCLHDKLRGDAQSLCRAQSVLSPQPRIRSGKPLGAGDNALEQIISGNLLGRGSVASA
jgi:hypothetical protein